MILWSVAVLILYIAGGALTAYALGRFSSLDHDAAAFTAVMWPVLGPILLPLVVFAHYAKTGANHAE